MPIERALERLRRAPTFAKVCADIESLVADPITEYITGLQLESRDGQDPGTKAVKDAVWGMIDLTRREVLVVDSPPVQRLRRIRQLGLGYLTYPTAGYSRFEHTLGSVHQANRMLQAVAGRTGRVVRRGTEERHSLEDEILASLTIVRLAAVLHDIGHLPLSHVSERFYGRSECPSARLVLLAEDLKDDVREHLDAKAPSLSECLSLATVLAPSFWTFLTDTVRYEAREVAAAAGAIVGRAPSTREAFVYQMITNVIDADKLDYMFRDGIATGVPLAVDLERLLFKLKCIELPVDRTPDELQAIRTDESPALVLGIDLAGQRLAYDVTVARTMLFERVYLHHKTRAAERVAMRRLEELQLEPAQLLRYDDALFTDQTEQLNGDASSRTIRMLRRRELPKRAYAMSYNYLPGVAIGELAAEPQIPPEAADSWRRLSRDLSHADARQRLEQKILLTAQRIAVALGDAAAITDIWVDTRPSRGDLGTWDLWVETPDGEKTVATTYAARAAAYAQSPAQTFYVYASGSGAVPAVAFLATELVVATRYGVFNGRRAADDAKVRFREVEQLKRELETAAPGIYDAVGRLRPEPRFLSQIRTRERIEVLAERFHHYYAQDKVRVDDKRIVDFLRQFPEALGEEMLAVLEELHYLGRAALGEEFAEFLVQGADDHENFVPLTQRADKSAYHLPYFLADERETRLNVVSLPEALTADAPITFFDDGVISGMQPRTAVQTWCGLPADLPDEAAQLAEPLSGDQLAALRARRLRFRFAYGHAPGLRSLAALTSEQDLGVDIAARIVEERERPVSEFGGASNELRAFLAAVGEDVLSSTKGRSNPGKWTSERCREYALGYGDRQQLVVLIYNAPTGAITALWKSGRFRGSPWLALFPRRGEPGVPRP